jgi:TetR/AcrR family transcriptional regulator, transcriptional repressor for nem operon
VAEYVQEHLLDRGDAAAKEDAMPYPPEHRERTRKRIVRSAQGLFNRRGFAGVSIDDIMADAGLTRGGFYKYFEKKSELYAEAIALSMREPPVSRWPSVAVDFAAADAARQVIRAYLSREHFEDVAGSCPLVALPSDVARSDPTVRRVFEAVFKAMVDLFEQGLGGRGGRQRALAMAGMCVGGMVVARSLEDARLANALRAATAGVALQLGGWPAPRGRSAGKRARGRRRGARLSGARA